MQPRAGSHHPQLSHAGSLAIPKLPASLAAGPGCQAALDKHIVDLLEGDASTPHTHTELQVLLRLRAALRSFAQQCSKDPVLREDFDGFAQKISRALADRAVGGSQWLALFFEVAHDGWILAGVQGQPDLRLHQERGARIKHAQALLAQDPLRQQEALLHLAAQILNASPAS